MDSRARFLRTSPRSAVPERRGCVLRQLCRGRLAIARVLGERAIEHILETGRQLRVERHQSARGVVDMCPELLEVALIYQLPSDGTSVRYETEVVYSPKGQERTLKGSLTISSVGQVNVDNEKCRWIEFKNVMTTEQGERILIAKCLIPEKDLGKGKSPGEHMIRGWIKLGDRDPQEFKEFDSQPGRDVLLGYLAGPSPNAKELDKSEVDGPLGKLACIVVTGDKDIQYGDRTMTINFENRLHEKRRLAS